MTAVVLDTSVLIAGFLSSRGAAGTLVDAFFFDRLQLVCTDEILGEYVEVLERPEFSAAITVTDRMAVVMNSGLPGCGSSR